MEEVNQNLLQELFLLGRHNAVEKVNQVLNGQLKELCLRTRYPKELDAFIAACLVQRGELEKGVGERCLFVRNREAWQRLSETAPPHRVFVAHPEIDFEANRADLLQQARIGEHFVIYALTNPRQDTPDVIALDQPQKFEVLQVLKRHNIPEVKAEQLTTRSNGNIYLLAQLLSETTERREWAGRDVGYRLRCLSLIGGWSDASKKDKNAISEILGEPYESWIQILFKYTKQEEPPVLLEGSVFRPVSRYEIWQQLGHYLTDNDLLRFKDAAIKVLSETEPSLELPKEKRMYAALQKNPPEICTGLLRRGIAETLALLAGQNRVLSVGPNAASFTAESVVWSLLNDAGWKQWASLSNLLPLLAEAAPTQFLSALEKTLKKPNESPIKELFVENDHPLFGRYYHSGLLWALEVLAWQPEYLIRVSVILAQLASYSLPKNMANNPVDCLRSTFLTWLPQTLGTIEQRRAAVEKVIEENFEVGWQLLMELLPEGHQTGSYNQKPVWREWLDNNWKEGVTRQEMLRQVRNYAELAVQCALKDLDKLIDIIGRWATLPSEVFKTVLDHLNTPVIHDLPEEKRFLLWQRLTDEISKHRRYSNSDWAMPEEDLKRLEAAAESVKPSKPSIFHRRLFNDYDHHFFTSDTDYDKQVADIAIKRSQAIVEIIGEGGLDAVLTVAQSVKLPAEVGLALGRVEDPNADAYLLPKHLETDDKQILGMVSGYVWARYSKMSSKWIETFDFGKWSSKQTATFFRAMPFKAEIWRGAEMALGNNKKEYWDYISPNTFQAGSDLIEATSKAIENKRGDIAVDAINCMMHKREVIPTDLAISAVKCWITNYSANFRVQHDTIEIVKHLQSVPDVDVKELCWIEFQLLKVLDHIQGASPLMLERQMANDPKFFHEMLTKAFVPESQIGKPRNLTEEEERMASHVFGLVYRWHIPPGFVQGGKLDQNNFKQWVSQAKQLCEQSGHWAIGQQIIGQTLANPPAGLEGLFHYPEVAKILDDKDSEEMRRGFGLAIINSRGVHGYSHGEEEKKFAKRYRELAEKYDLAGFSRIAVELRGIADSYQHESEREAARDPYKD